MKKMKKLHLLLAALLLTLLIPVCKPTIVEAATLKAPKTLTVKQGKNNISVQWSKVSGAKGYVVYRKNSPSQGWKRLKVVKAPTLKYLDKSISSGKSYYYTVRPYTSKSGKNSYGTYSKSGKNIVYLKEPKVTATKSATSVTLKWNKTTGASGYEVYRKSGSSGYSKIKTTTALSYKDTAVKPNTKYTYAVRAYKKSGSTTFRSLYYDGANLVSVKTQAEVQDPVEPDPVPDINDAVESKIYPSSVIDRSIIEIYNKSNYNYFGILYEIDFYDKNGKRVYKIPKSSHLLWWSISGTKEYQQIILPSNISYSTYKVNYSVENNYNIDKYKKTYSLWQDIKIGNIYEKDGLLCFNVTNMSDKVFNLRFGYMLFIGNTPIKFLMFDSICDLNVRETETIYINKVLPEELATYDIRILLDSIMAL